MRRIFGGRGRPHGDSSATAPVMYELVVCALDRGTQGVGNLAVENQLAERAGARLERSRVVDVDAGELGASPVSEIVRVVELTVPVDGDDEAGRNREPRRGHFAEIRPFSTQGRNV